MIQRLAIIGFVVAVIVAAVLFLGQQQAVRDAQVAGTAQVIAENLEGTSAAQAEAASVARLEAEVDRSEAVRDADAAATAQSNAEATAAAAINVANLASTSQAAIQATAVYQMTGAAELAEAQIATVRAESESGLATANAQAEAVQANADEFAQALATATAQVDLANFAAMAAEDDRAAALANSREGATQIARLENALETAQVQLNGQPPNPTSLPATPSPLPDSTFDATGTSAPAVPATQDAPATTSAPDTALGATFTTEDGIVSIRYPDNWLAGETEDGTIVIVTSEEVISRQETTLNSGLVETYIYFVLGTRITGQETATTANEVAAALAASLSGSEDSTIELGDVTDLTLGGRTSARMSGVVGDNDTLIVVIDVGNDFYAVAFITTADGELADYEALLLSILETLEINAATP